VKCIRIEPSLRELFLRMQLVYYRSYVPPYLTLFITLTAVIGHSTLPSY